MPKESPLSPEYNAFLSEIITKQISQLAPEISRAHYDGELPYLHDLMSLALADKSASPNSEVGKRFVEETMKYRNSGEEFSIVLAQSMLARYHLGIGQVEEGGLYLQDAVDDASYLTNPEDRDKVTLKLVVNYVSTAIDLGRLDVAAEVLQKHRQELITSETLKKSNMTLMALAVESIKHPDLYREVADIIEAFGQKDILSTIKVLFKSRQRDVSTDDLWKDLQDIDEPGMRIFTQGKVAKVGFEQAREDLGNFFADNITELLFGQDDDISSEASVELAADVIRDIFKFRRDVAEQLLRKSLDEISEIDDFPAMKRAYGHLFRAMSIVSEEAHDTEAIPVSELTQIRDHALKRFADTANFLEVESAYAISLYPKDPRPAEEQLARLEKSQAGAIDHKRKFEFLEAQTALMNQLTIRLINLDEFDLALRYIGDRQDVERQIEDLQVYHTDLTRLSKPDSVDKDRAYLALAMAKRGDGRVKTVVDQIKEVPALLTAVSGLAGVLDQRAA